MALVDELAAEATRNRREWDRCGVVVLRGVLPVGLVAELDDQVRRLEKMDPAPGGPLQHSEQTDAGAVIARSERFADLLPVLGRFLRDDVSSLVEAVCGEPVVLFKEKVNYKHPGGGGFAPHQDARAYRFAQRHISVMVPLDPATRESGCLWFARGAPREMLEADPGGRIEDSVASALDWEPVEVAPGDVVVFDSLAPHRSGTNTADHSRRAMYLTYNPASEGDFRERYYADKEEEFADSDGTFGGSRVRISISDDFLGRPVTTPGPIEGLVELYSSELSGQLYDEAVTELEHALQAGWLAEQEGAPEELVAAALLHDVGHLVVGDLRELGEELEADEHHEGVGASLLRPVLGAAVADPVALHVAAKRYLCAVDPAYLEGLSASSLRSLGVQGGPMSPAEVEAFESNERFEAARAVRIWDDRAKVAGAPTPPFSHVVPLLERLAEREARGTRPRPG
ncbi:MAG: phytanoyl-CoA dioxygenase family protein [Microthrixaceae bacterium]